jgi:hypothetical protein
MDSDDRIRALGYAKKMWHVPHFLECGSQSIWRIANFNSFFPTYRALGLLNGGVGRVH